MSYDKCVTANQTKNIFKIISWGIVGHQAIINQKIYCPALQPMFCETFYSHFSFHPFLLKNLYSEL